jgi:exopolyphosphatase/guanosine-5'-triphosphate,3'-diphosphate pyrophosphatase
VSQERRVAVIDLGTNSTRLLVADVASDGQVREVERRTEVTRLGDGVDSSGRLSAEATTRVLACLEGYLRRAGELGTTETVAVATSAVRDAANGAEFREAVRERTEVDLRIISGDEEGRLTFLGATAGRPPAEEGATLVIDIGGGSTEYVLGRPGSLPDFHVSTRLGSVRHTERHLSGDPPEEEGVARLAEDAAAVVTAEVPEERRRAVGAGVAVAGTATSLAAIDQRLDPYDPQRVHGYELTLAACERMLSMLAALPLVERREVAGLHPDRAPTIVAGVIILVESMRAFGLDSLEVGEADLLHGAALEAHPNGGQ